ncbi:hypothetical protein CK203_052249 [Vitis vinifera]|uniref:DUF659 domain-containing protein n=1 Tax=Vitis vinifera TaxID=29760 RepID=A0A438GPM0_VITVI|nr:hypothetical protein CK203_052249 [Vitis vinifera]
MASEGGSAMPGRDPAWKYCSPIEDMHPDEQDAYRSAVCASKASNWEREQHENIVGSKRKSGESSTGIPSTMRKSQSMRHFASFTPYCPSLYKSSAAKTKNIKDIFKGGAIKETMGRLISKFFIYESVAPVKAKSHHFKEYDYWCTTSSVGMGIEPPSPYEIKNKYLEMEYKNGSLCEQTKGKWKTYGTIIKEVGKENVVQIVTDNGSAFMKAGKQLMKKYNLYWTPCAAHCIDLIFEDIGKRPNVIEVINNARKITNFIYNHVVPTMSFVYELMQVMKENLIRQGAGDWMFKIIQDRWQKTLNIHFMQQMQKEDSGDRAAIASRSTMVPENDRVAEKDYLDLLDISAEVGEEEDNQLFQWKFTLKVLAKILMILFMRHIPAKRLTPQVLAIVVDLVLQVLLLLVYDGSRGGTDDGGDNGGGDIDERRHSQYPINQFTCENDFTHCTQDEDPWL